MFLISAQVKMIMNNFAGVKIKIVYDAGILSESKILLNSFLSKLKNTIR